MLELLTASKENAKGGINTTLVRTDDRPCHSLCLLGFIAKRLAENVN